MTTPSDTGGDAAAVENCPSCGAENDISFTYCRHCLERLPNTATR